MNTLEHLEEAIKNLSEIHKLEISALEAELKEKNELLEIVMDSIKEVRAKLYDNSN